MMPRRRTPFLRASAGGPAGRHWGPQGRAGRAGRRLWTLGLAAAFALAGLPGPAGPALGAVWTNVNPGGGGAFTCIAAGPSGILVVGSDIGGVYRSDNHGGTWENVGSLNGGLDRCYIASVAFNPANPWAVYLGTDGGLYRSGNGARTFSLVIGGGFWSAIGAAASDGNIVYAARHGAYNSTDVSLIYRSPNQGQNWQLVGSLPAGLRVIKLEVKPNNPNHLFALSGYEKLVASSSPRRALYVSSDGGATWTDAHGDSTNQGMTGNPWDAAYDTVHPDTIFATSVVGAGNVDESSTWSGYTWRGSQSGGIWTQVSAHTGAIVVRHASGQVATIDARRDGPGCTECGVFNSVNWGASWTRVSDMSGWDPGWIGSIAWAYNSSFSGMGKTLRRDPTNSAVIYWITPQFVWRSTNWGASFTSMFTNQAAPGFWMGRGINNVAPATLSVSGTALYAGYYDLGIWRSFNSGASWQSSNDPGLTGGWAGKGGSCMTILADPARSNVVWASQGETMNTARLIRNSDSGLPGTWTTTLGMPPGFIAGLALDPASPTSNRTLYASSNGDVYTSVDDGVNWNMVFDCDSCYVNAAAGGTIFTGGPKGLWRSLDGGATWGELAPATFHLAQTTYSQISAKWNGPHSILTAGDTVLVANLGKNRGLYRSLDGGDSWSLIRADDYAIEVEVDDNGWLYMGSSSATNAGGTGMSGSSGIQISRDSGANWSSLTSGLPWPFAWPIETMPVGGGSVRLFVGSPGSGFWTSVVSVVNPLAVGDVGGTGLGLVGFRPNPARGRVAVAFSLPTPEPAVLEVFDVAGRRVFRRDVGWLGSGSHVLPLGSDFRPAPGLYTIRLAQAGRSVHTRSVVVR